ncbi:unnamed protein product [Paramecium octaurelia]|uniref:Uncharacterized protein n=1 Tax=Paramecium octaurelia TaxID=43137 RepID=A0A8S1XVG7_PAROT|nr:unnamed protein product [Paramecium octaurelia]
MIRIQQRNTTNHYIQTTQIYKKRQQLLKRVRYQNQYHLALQLDDEDLIEIYPILYEKKVKKNEKKKNYTILNAWFIAFLRFLIKCQIRTNLKSFNEQGQCAIHIGVMIQSIEMSQFKCRRLLSLKTTYFALVTDNLQILRLLLVFRASPWDQKLRDYFVCCRSEDANNLIKLASYLKIYNKDAECLLNMENIKQQ